MDTKHPGSGDRLLRRAVSRRGFLRTAGSLGAAAGAGALLPGWARSAAAREAAGAEVLDARAGPIDLRIARTRVAIDGRESGQAVTLNGTIPGPLLRFREGGEAVIRVHNALDEDTSIHWHGILVPNPMDGVPKVNFPGIRPGETFVYRYPVRQYGAYWYHSHSGLQEQLGHYGPLVIEPAGGEPYTYDREHFLVLSDWTFESPYRVLAKLKKHPDYYNFQKRTVVDFFRDVAAKGLGATLREREMWGRMRMNPTDISDITGATYTYLVNGAAPEDGFTALFRPGERVLFHLVNASAGTFFDVRFPGLTMEVVQASGQHVQPVRTEELRIAIAETYSVLVQPEEDRAYPIFAEAMDRSGFALGTLAPRPGMRAAAPARRKGPVLTMADMGMVHAGTHGGGGHEHGGAEHGDGAGDRDGAHGGGGGAGHAGMRHGAAHDADVRGLRPAGTLPDPVRHGPDHHGPGNAAVAETSRSRLHEPGVGLGEDGWPVLTYVQLRSLAPEPRRPPDREIELHLTGNMERFMWSIDGVKFSDAEPIPMRLGERIRLTMVNDTMMNHPMHLHGMWMELENGQGEHIPRLHTVNVKPAERLSLLVTVDAPGPWAFHCHVLYHMEAGMFRVVKVIEPGASDDAAPGAPGGPRHDH